MLTSTKLAFVFFFFLFLRLLTHCAIVLRPRKGKLSSSQLPVGTSFLLFLASRFKLEENSVRYSILQFQLFATFLCQPKYSGPKRFQLRGDSRFQMVTPPPTTGLTPLRQFVQLGTFRATLTNWKNTFNLKTNESHKHHSMLLMKTK